MWLKVLPLLPQATYAADDLWHVHALALRAARMRGADAAAHAEARPATDDSEAFQDDIDIASLPRGGEINFTDDGGVGYRLLCWPVRALGGSAGN